MLQNAKVTAFTVSELLKENQQGGKITPPPPFQIRVKIWPWKFWNIQGKYSCWRLLPGKILLVADSIFSKTVLILDVFLGIRNFKNKFWNIDEMLLQMFYEI